MVTDLGLHLKKNRFGMKNTEPDDLEVRKRLYLSVFAWDKCDYPRSKRADSNQLTHLKVN